MGKLTQAAAEMHALKAELARHIEDSKRREKEIRAEILQRTDILAHSAAGIDLETVKLAKTIITVRGTYARGGDDRGSVIADAIQQLSLGSGVGPYKDLWNGFFGTKSYSQWYGQRSDHPYGYGPGHGSIIFAVGVTDNIRRDRKQSDLTPEEVEAAIYYLTNLERIQDAEQKAMAESAA